MVDNKTSYRLLMDSLKILEDEYKYRNNELRLKIYSSLSDNSIEYHKKIINDNQNSIWDRKAVGISISDSICATSCPVYTRIKFIKKVFNINALDYETNL